MRFTVFVQSGGRSSRMGQDKAWLEIGGRPMIEHVIEAARPLTGHLFVIINKDNPDGERYRKLATVWRARVLHDLHDHRGPLGGIHTALSKCAPEESAIILACDLPFLTPELLSLLARIHENEEVDLTLPLDESGRMQPMAGIYSKRCLPHVEGMLADDILRVDRLCPLVRARRVPFVEYAHLPGASRFLTNINTLEDYDRLIRG